tara:strand:+ start:533 stop:697 length:165 start_codon:yes stop_codon:yes gene_type:complete
MIIEAIEKKIKNIKKRKNVICKYIKPKNKKSAAKEPQVPGAIGKRPTPKKVENK